MENTEILQPILHILEGVGNRSWRYTSQEFKLVLWLQVATIVLILKFSLWHHQEFHIICLVLETSLISIQIIAEEVCPSWAEEH